MGLSHVCLSLKKGTLGNVATRGLSVSLSVSSALVTRLSVHLWILCSVNADNHPGHRQMMLGVPQSTPWTGESKQQKGRTTDIGSISS